MVNIAFAGLTAAGKTTHAQRRARDLEYRYVSATEIIFETAMIMAPSPRRCRRPVRTVPSGVRRSGSRTKAIVASHTASAGPPVINAWRHYEKELDGLITRAGLAG